MKGNQIKYDIKDVTNDSTVALTDFYWRDIIPTDVTRLAKVVTGTYNQSVKFKITANTNKGNTLTIADNLKTTKNNVVDCSNAALGLPSDEYVTSVTLYFGNVKAGFAMVDNGAVFLNVLNINLPNGYQFSNKCDVGGQYNGEWAIGNATWTTSLYSPGGSGKLPKTGW